jgi:hypothetical protein
MVGVGGFNRPAVEVIVLFQNLIWLCRRILTLRGSDFMRPGLVVWGWDWICWDAWLVLLW